MIHDVTSPDKMLGVGVSLKKKDTTTIYFIQIERSLYFFYEYKSCLLIYWSSLKFNFFENEKISDVRFVFTSSICLQEDSCLIYCLYLLHLFVGGLVSYLRSLRLFVYSGFQHIWCCVFILFVFVFCTHCCQFLWIVIFDGLFGILQRLLNMNKYDFASK